MKQRAGSRVRGAASEEAKLPRKDGDRLLWGLVGDVANCKRRRAREWVRMEINGEWGRRRDCRWMGAFVVQDGVLKRDFSLLRIGGERGGCMDEGRFVVQHRSLLLMVTASEGWMVR